MLSLNKQMNKEINYQMELNNSQKRYLKRIMEFIKINTYHDLSIEAYLGLEFLKPKNQKIHRDFYEAINKHILRVKKKLGVK